MVSNSSQFYTQKDSNEFDNLRVDVPRLYAQFPIEKMGDLDPDASGKELSSRLYRTRILPLSLRLKIWRLLFRSQIDQAWFNIFNQYWVRILGGRPLWSIHDFYFLKNVYRAKFQSNVLPDDPTFHLAAWQRPELIYQLFHLASKETAFADANLVRRALKLAGGGSRLQWLEFGCGTAPITDSAVRFFPLPSKCNLVIADIQTLAFHYAAYRFRNTPAVKPIQLTDPRDLKLEKPLDVVFCIQVFEHLPNPLETAQQLAGLLRPGGLLVFDFIKASGEGMDSASAATERPAVLRFLTQQFRIAGKAELNTEKSLNQTFAIKK